MTDPFSIPFMQSPGENEKPATQRIIEKIFSEFVQRVNNVKPTD
jgi:hypothetical protein